MTIWSQYMHQVRRESACTPPCRKKFIRSLEPLVDDFAGENPEASLAEYEEAFGAPESLAQQYMSTLDQEEVRRYREQKKHLRWAAWAVIALIFVGMAIGLVAKYTRVFEPPVTAETTLIVIPGVSSIDEGDAVLNSILKERGYLD